jgi:hypothetical protein
MSFAVMQDVDDLRHSRKMKDPWSVRYLGIVALRPLKEEKTAQRHSSLIPSESIESNESNRINQCNLTAKISRSFHEHFSAVNHEWTQT